MLDLHVSEANALPVRSMRRRYHPRIQALAHGHQLREFDAEVVSVFDSQKVVDEPYALRMRQSFAFQVVKLILESASVEKLPNFAHEYPHLLLVRG